MKCVIVSEKAWHKDYITQLSDIAECTLIDNRKDFTFEYLSELAPKWIFIPHWSYIVPHKIYENFRCVIFHMTDLPFGRGGSPLQNLIVRGFRRTKISAIECSNTIDAGDIYTKEELDLSGTATEIFARASTIILSMIRYIILNNPRAEKQNGDIVQFKRRTANDSNIVNLDTIEQIYDYIRMLDCDGYPHAFINTQNISLHFTNASLHDGHVMATVCIKKL